MLSCIPLPVDDTFRQDQVIDLGVEAAAAGGQPGAITSVGLILDGAALHTWTCDPTEAGCSVGYVWSVSQSSVGLHQLWVRTTLASGVVVVGSLTHVEIDPAPATITISSPVQGQTVHGVVHVVAKATVLAGSGDSIATMSLSVDGSPVGAAKACAGQPTTCAAAFAWDTTTVGTPSVASNHGLIVSVQTADGYTTEKQIGVRVDNTPVATITVPAELKAIYGSTVHFRGTVTNRATHHPMPGVPVTLTFAPHGGHAVVRTVATDSHGGFVANDPHPVLGATQVTATVGAAYGRASAHTAITVAVAVTCTSSAGAKGGALVTCAVKGLPTGTPVSLAYANRTFHGLVHAKAKAGRVIFTISHPTHTWVNARVSTPATAVLIASRSRSYAVRLA